MKKHVLQSLFHAILLVLFHYIVFYVFVTIFTRSLYALLDIPVLGNILSAFLEKEAGYPRGVVLIVGLILISILTYKVSKWLFDRDIAYDLTLTISGILLCACGAVLSVIACLFFGIFSNVITSVFCSSIITGIFYICIGKDGHLG